MWSIENKTGGKLWCLTMTGIQAVEHTFQRHETAIAEALPHLVTHVRSGTQVSQHLNLFPLSPHTASLSIAVSDKEVP